MTPAFRKPGSAKARLALSVACLGILIGSCDQTTITILTVSEVSVTPSSPSVTAGQTVRLTATARSSVGATLKDRSVTWSSGNASLATVDASGLVTGVGSGDAVITATIEGRSGTATVSVMNPIPVVDSISPDSALVGAAGFTLTVHGSGFVAASVVRWEGSDRTTTFVSATQLRAAISAADIAGVGAMAADGGMPADSAMPADSVRSTSSSTLVGTASVTVFNPSPGGGTSGAVAFSVVTTAGVPATPTDLGALATSYSQINLTWTDTSSDEDEFRIERKTGAGGSWTELTTVGANSTAYLDYGVSPSTTYYYRVRACNSNGCSAPSEETWATTSESPGITGWASVSSGMDHTCGVTASGEAYCWGSGVRGRLGNGTTWDQLTPARVSGEITFRYLSAGASYTCGLATSGQAYCWGADAWGRLGNGTTLDQHVPTQVSGGLTFGSLTAGMDHACGVTTNGDAYCWGYGLDGRLGDVYVGGDFTAVPLLVSGGHTFSSVSAGDSHTCGLTTSGEAYCWGKGDDGRLGNGSTSHQSTPVPVSGGHTFGGLTAGNSHTCGVTTGGEAHCWGVGYWGQLGDGSTMSNQSTPVPVSGGHAFQQLSGANEHTCGVTTSGEAYCWGHGVSGRLGNGSDSDQSTPVPVSGGHDFRDVSGGDVCTCGVTTGGDAYCWGDGYWGQLGNGSTSEQYTPVKVGDAKDGLGSGFGPEQFSLIPAGTFQMGSINGNADEKPVHTVNITQPFYMQKTEVTQGQWRDVMGSNPSSFSSCGDTCPVENVSWDDVQLFLQALNAIPGANYRLPTEAEWEYAARAGTTGDFGGSGVLDDMGWFTDNSEQRTHTVATKQANAWGLYDMHGNVQEWVQDWYASDYYGVSPTNDPPGPATGTQRVLRSGAWNVDPFNARSARRLNSIPTNQIDHDGFRLARSGLSITTSSLANGGVGTPYNQTMAATGGGGDDAWSIIGRALPSGLSLDASSGVISGTPTSAGTWDFTVQLASGGATATKDLSITVTSDGTGLGIGFGDEQFSLIPAGTFQMGATNGDADEQPVHTVNITQSFQMQKTEVTQGQWRAVTGSDPSRFSSCGDTCPVEQVSWDEVQTFLATLNAQHPGKGYRLPTEAE